MDHENIETSTELKLLKTIADATLAAQAITSFAAGLDDMKVIFMAFVGVMARSHPNEVHDALMALGSVLDEQSKDQGGVAPAS